MQCTCIHAFHYNTFVILPLTRGLAVMHRTLDRNPLVAILLPVSHPIGRRSWKFCITSLAATPDGRVRQLVHTATTVCAACTRTIYHFNKHLCTSMYIKVLQCTLMYTSHCTLQYFNARLRAGFIVWFHRQLTPRQATTLLRGETYSRAACDAAC